jgi:RNA polymerase sigma factor (sigma-70 family)
LSGFGFLRVYSCKRKMTDSHTLLSQYATTGSESAFRELVSRYIDLVYSTAFRLVDGNVESAQDVTQTVFVALADQARTLPKDVMLGGWLHLRTRFAAGKLMRAERRRQLRERQAAEMNAIEDHSESNLAQVAPVLDEAIGQLNAEDRNAILLRFFERKDFRGVGDALGSSEDAARKRVDRALEKLYVLLKHRGATLSAAALGTALATEAVTAAPAGLAGSVAGAALASAAAGTATTLGVLKSMALAKLPLGAAGLVAVGLLVAFLFREHQHNRAHSSGKLNQFIEITAGIDVTYFHPDPANANGVDDKTWHYTAVCTVGAGRWRIDHDYSLNGEASLLCDSTNVYQLMRITKPLPPFPPDAPPIIHQLGLDRELPAEAYSDRFIYIWPGDLPLADVGANLPWLAFCSGHYLKRKDRVLPLLCTSIRITADAFAYRDRTSCFDDELGLPRSVDWEFSASAFAKSPDDPKLERGDYVMKMHSILGTSLREGVLRSRYIVHEWTNYSGLHIPIKFELIEYGDIGQWSSKPGVKAVGQVASIRRATEPQGVFLVSTTQFVNDYRFRSSDKLVDFIHYNWPNNVIPSTSDPNLVALFKRTEARAPADPTPVVHWWRILPGLRRP